MRPSRRAKPFAVIVGSMLASLCFAQSGKLSDDEYLKGLDKGWTLLKVQQRPLLNGGRASTAAWPMANGTYMSIDTWLTQQACDYTKPMIVREPTAFERQQTWYEQNNAFLKWGPVARENHSERISKHIAQNPTKKRYRGYNLSDRIGNERELDPDTGESVYMWSTGTAVSDYPSWMHGSGLSTYLWGRNNRNETKVYRTLPRWVQTYGHRKGDDLWLYSLSGHDLKRCLRCENGDKGVHPIRSVLMVIRYLFHEEKEPEIYAAPAEAEAKAKATATASVSLAMYPVVFQGLNSTMRGFRIQVPLGGFSFARGSVAGFGGNSTIFCDLSGKPIQINPPGLPPVDSGPNAWEHYNSQVGG